MSEQLDRIAAALERIADALEAFGAAEELPCPHPEAEREVMPGSTMTDVRYRCTACGAEDIER